MVDFNSYTDLNVYTISFSREHLDKVFDLFRKAGIVEPLVEKTGEISLNIPKNFPIEITEVNILTELFDEMEKMEEIKSHYTSKDKKFKDLTAKQDGIFLAIDAIIKVYKRKLKL